MASPDDRPLILFASRRAPPPYFLGGAEISQALLARELHRAGYRIRCLGSFDEPWPGGGRIRERLLGWLRREGIEPAAPVGEELDYRWHGIECRACIGERLARLLAEELTRQPLMVIASQEGSANLLGEAARAGAASVGWVHSISKTGIGTAGSGADEILCVSEFVRQRVRERTGREGRLFYPTFAPAAGDEEGSRDGHLTIVNPIPEKGSELFAELVLAFPERRFVAVDGWYRAALPALPNLRRLRRPAAMAEVWRGTSLLLVPSRLEEGFGRVCVEAGQRGIPSLTSGLGGLPEAAGPGGRVAGPDAFEEWTEAIEAMLAEVAWRALGEAGRRYAARFDRDPVAELRGFGILP